MRQFFPSVSPVEGAQTKTLYDLLGARENDDADALKKAFRKAIKANHPDMTDLVARMAAHVPPDQLLRCIEAVLECREALAVNVKPKFAVDAMVATFGQALRD